MTELDAVSPFLLTELPVADPSPMATILASNGFGHEPLDLDRLAKDLALRESQQPRTSTTIETSHELPLFIPLSHTNPLLSVSGNPTFDVDAFLLSRSNTSLSDLRTELRDYLAVLKEELVQLINDDYADFISLRTDLRGEGARLEALEEPLEKIRDEIEVRVLDLIEMNYMNVAL